MIRIIADDKIPFLKGVLEPYAKVTYLPGNQINKYSISGTDALLVRTRTRCNDELLSGTPVKFIGTATIGFDHIDTEYCEKNGIKWTNAPGCNSSSVQQYIASALLRISGETGFSLKDLCESFDIPLGDWYPSEIPAPPESVLTIDCNGKSTEEILRRAIFHTYNIIEDDIRLRFDPTRFEKERENYPFRREFSCYTVDLKDGNEEISKLLKSLGFKVTN